MTVGAGKIVPTQPVQAQWTWAAFTDGTTSEQVVSNRQCVLGGLIPLHGTANLGLVTLNDGTNNFVFSASGIPIGGQFFGGGLLLPELNITLTNTNDDILVLYRNSN